MTFICKKVQLTKEGYRKLKDELDYLEFTLRPKNNKRVKHARSFCDFNEDSEYEAALKEQADINERIKKLQKILSTAEIIELSNTSELVTLGSTVTIRDKASGEEETYTVVMAEEADAVLGKISVESPLGQALLGSEQADEREVNTPNGLWHIKIVGIK